MATTTKLLTAEQYLAQESSDRPTELIRGEVVVMNPPTPEHGEICGQVLHLLRTFIDPRRLGRAMVGDSGVITARGPDTVRGADVAFYSAERMPLDRRVTTYNRLPPNLVFEIWSPSNRRGEMQEKVNEYLAVGVDAVVVLIPGIETAEIYLSDGSRLIAIGDDPVPLPAPLTELSLSVRTWLGWPEGLPPEME